MAVELDSLVVQLQARDEQFLTAVRRVESRLDDFGVKVNQSTSKASASFQKLSGSINIVQRALGALGAVGALGGLTKLVTGAVEASSKLVDTADRIGITVEALQQLQFAATQSGIPVDKFTLGLQTFTRRLSEAAAGTGKAKDIIKKFGLDAAALAKDPVKAFDLIADKIKAIPVQAQRLEAARKFFDRTGDSFVNLLQIGGPAIDELKQKIRDLGGVIEGDLARKSEALGDAFEESSLIIKTQFQTALLELAPVLVSTAKLAAELTAGIVDLAQKAGVLSTSIPKQIQQTSEALFKAQQELTRLQEKKAGPGNENVVAEFFDTLGREIDAKSGQITEFKEQLKGLQAEFVKTATPVKKATGELENLGGATDKTAAKFDKLIKRTKERGESLNLTGVALADYKAKVALADGATQEQAASLRAAIIVEEQAKATKIANTKAIAAKTAALKKEAAEEKKTAQEIKAAELLVNKLAAEKIKLDKEDAKANAASLLALQNDIAAAHEEGQLIQASLGTKEELRALEESIAIARIKRQIATERVAAAENLLTIEEDKELESKQKQLIANVKGAAAVQKYNDALADAALTTADLKNVTSGLLEGDIAGTFEQLGQTVGDRLIDGILFGKGQKEQQIIGNFNQLLGVDAAGLFGAQGGMLGNTLISSITAPIISGGKSLLSKAGIDLGGLFGGSFNSAASGVIGGSSSTAAGSGIFSNVVSGSSTTAGASGGALGTIFGAAIAGAAGIAFGKGLSGIFGVGGSKPGKLGGTIGGGIGGIGGGIAGFLLGGPAGAAIGSALGGALGTIFGGFIGDFFKQVKTKGSQIRKGVKDFLKEIEVSFAGEIDSSDYFFEETKKLADKMFGGDFLEASKQILNDKIGPELAQQLQALGTFITADQAKKLGKSVEQTGTTFGNLLLDNLGVDPDEIDAAVKEIVEKADISFAQLADKLNKLFEKGKISQDFFNDAIAGTVAIFAGDLPDAIGAASIALKSFGEDGLFDIEKFNAEIAKVTSSFDLIVSSFIDVVRNSKPGEDIGALLAEQIQTGLETLAVDAFLKDFVTNKLFEGIDLSDGLGADELAKIIDRASEARKVVETLTDAFGETGEAVDKTADKVDDLFDKLRNLSQQRFDLRLDVIGNLENIGVLSGVDAARARIGAGRGRLQGLAAGSRTDFTDAELEQGLEAIRDLRKATVDLFQAQEQAAQQALQNRIQDIQADFSARKDALDAEAEAVQAAAQARIEGLGRERDQVQEIFQLRLDGLQKELQIAEDFKRVAESLQQTINGLIQSASPFSKPEQLAAFQRQASELRGRIAGASQEDKPGLIQELSNLLSSQLQIGKDFLDPTRFAAQFQSVVEELENLRNQATAEGDRAEVLQQQIADTTLQMEAQLRSIDASIQLAQQEAANAQIFFQQQAAELSRMEQEAISAAEEATSNEITQLRITAAEEIRNLALIEDAILAAQEERLRAQVDLSVEQISVLRSILGGIVNLENSLLTAFNGIISAQSGFNGITTKPQLFLAHGNEHVQITPAGKSSGNAISVSVSVPISINGAQDNPRATEEAIIQMMADAVRKDGKVRAAIKGVK